MRAAVLAVALTISCQGVQAGTSDLFAGAKAREQSLERAWSKQLQDPETKVVKYKSPIQRVVGLMTEMKDQLTKEGSKEAEMYDKMVCWCETNEKEKTAAIAAADTKDAELVSQIEAQSAKSGQLSTDIENLKKQIAADEEAVKQATALREGGAGEFSAEEKELLQAITNLNNAIEILSKHNSASFLQVQSPVLASLHAVLQDVALKYDMLLGDGQGPSSRVNRKTHATAFLGLDVQKEQSAGKNLLSALGIMGQDSALPLNLAEHMLKETIHDAPKASAFVQQPNANSGSYSPQSNTIFGILTQMKEEFEANLSQSQKDEAKSAEDYKEMMAAKQEQIAAAKERLDEMETDNAANTKALSDAKEDLELTRAQRTKDVEFLRNLKVTCNDLDSQWSERSKTRAEELAAVSEAISILTEDDAMDLLRQTAAFLQVDADSTARMRQSRAVSLLRRAAMSPDFEADDLVSAWHSRNGKLPAVDARSQLSTLAVSVQLDGFEKVKEMMQKMVADLKEEQKNEVAFKANCVKNLNENEKATYTKNEEKEDLEAELDNLAKTIADLEAEIAAAKQQITDTEVEVKKGSQRREEENGEFQTTVADQRATQEILKKALDRLGLFYKKEAKEGALLQNKQTPPVQFNTYKKNAGSGPVMGLIEQIIEDSKKLETEAVAAESKAQADYESFVKDSNDMIAELNTAINDKTKTVAEAKLKTAEAESDHTSAVEELASLAEYNTDLHNQCDWLTKNFEVRQTARLQEIEAIQAAEGILSGSK